MSSTALLAPWQAPSPPSVEMETGLKVMNTLTRKKEKFVPMDGSRRVCWYMCGPTVYAPSHMGHARTYLSFDIIRRILASYFHYDVFLVMNITDLDDKIIARANESGITCTELAREFEKEFHEDMEALGVSPPDVLTRVTEYMDEIIEYIEVIVQKDMGYESNGSVYFNVENFKAGEGMHYCKLSPENQNNSELLAEGEGKLSQDFITDKKSPRDFALWKASKEGEPSWASPWGPGRPGWHIECSVMASRIFSQLTSRPGMDLHSGGKDLKFPHHDNEMAQAEAHSSSPQWVNYFLHSGHLHIDGSKMSKSLKNFITIQEALDIHTPRQMRFCFLLHKYNADMDYSHNTMQHALVTEKLFSEFFHNLKAYLRDHCITQPQKWDQGALNLQKKIHDTKSSVHAALQDDFDTPAVIQHLQDLVKAVNLYVKDNDKIVSLLLCQAGNYITEIFSVFGLLPDNHIGFPSSSSASKEAALSPLLHALMSFRSDVRDAARNNDSQGVLNRCDRFRDENLPPLGVRLEDKPDGTSLWKLADPEELMREREQKLAEARRKEEEKALKAQEAAKKEALNKLTPKEFMKQLALEDGSLKYSQFDEEGMPTHIQGEPLNKSQEKKAKKEWQNQQKKYDKSQK